MGNVTAARKTGRILTTLADHNFGLVVLLGIGGGISDDVGLGDVVVVTEVTNYQVRSKIVDADGGPTGADDGSATDEPAGSSAGGSEPDADASTLADLTPSGWEWLPGGLTRRVDEAVEQAIDTFRNNPTWYEDWQDSVSVFRTREVELTGGGVTPDMFHEPPLVHHEPITSGGMVIASRSFGEQLDAQNRNFALVEMEAAGVMEVVDTTPGVNVLVLRGVSDFADERKCELDGANKGQWRTYATYAAAEYLRHFLEAGMLEIGAADHDLPVRGSLSGESSRLPAGRARKRRNRPGPSTRSSSNCLPSRKAGTTSSTATGRRASTASPSATPSP